MKNRKLYENGGLEIKEAKFGAMLLCLGAVVTFVFALVSVRLLVMPSTHADTEAVVQTSFTVSSSCSMSSDIDTAHESDIAPGVYESEIGETTITTICNDANGYAVYATGFTNNELGRNDMLGQSSGRTIATGTATSGGTSNWAMRLTPVDNTVAPTIATGYEDYHTVPGEYTKVVSFANNTTTNDAGSKFKITFAGFVSSTQAADTYNGKVKYVLVHPANSTETPCVGTYTINYDSNGGSGNMDSQTVCMDRNTIVLADGFTPPDANSQFFAWNTASDGSGYTYHPGQSVMNLANVGDSVTLYAQWTPRYIQDLTASTCQLLTLENPYTVYDRRDGSDYGVRYVEGACWMTQNLRITGTVNAQYSNFSTYSNVNVCESDLTDGDSFEVPRCHDSGNTTDGVWYNYAAASAKSITGSNNAALATEDICPAGWSLPSYDTTNAPGSINSLVSTSAASILKFTPVTGGHYVGGSLIDTDNGWWWSTMSTTGFQGASYYDFRQGLSYDGNNLSITRSHFTYWTDGYSRLHGTYIRCVRL